MRWQVFPKVTYVSGYHVSLIIFATLMLVLMFLYNHFHAYTRPIVDKLRIGQVEVSSEPLPCFGPRGQLLSESAEDGIGTTLLDYAYPEPLGGAYEILGLDQTWATAQDCYGAYGYSENDTDAPSGRVDWATVDWSALQDNCTARNKPRFPEGRRLMSPPRMSPPSWKTRIKWPSSHPSTGRTAIVIRTWDVHKFGKQDMVFVRSIIVEAALASKGQHAVYLMVDVKDRRRKIFESESSYKAALEELVPNEFQNIAALFDGTLLDKWYPKVGEHAVIHQVFQPLQIFAQIYDAFDHYWNMEMDVRFTGNTLDHLEALSRFSRNEPRKQALERGSFRYIPAVHGTYDEFLSAVNESVDGRGLWQRPRIPEIAKPVGPTPPASDPLNDDFQWGRGEEADFISMVPCSNVSSEPRWFGNSYIFGFKLGQQTPRFFCPQAVGRASWKLLNAVHVTQRDLGARIPSEATLPSFAYWHGLKISVPPQPWFIDSPRSAAHMNELFNGGPPRTEWHGFANGTTKWNDTAFDEYYTMHPTWRWASKSPDELMDAWMDHERSDQDPLPYLLRRHEGQIYAPNVALHPVKTERNK